MRLADRSQRLTLSDVAALIRLAGEVGELPAHSDARRRHILDRLCELCQADKGAYGEFVKRSGEWRPRAGKMFFHNTPVHELKKVDYFYKSLEPRDPVIDRMSQSLKDILVATPRTYFTDSEWRQHPHYNEVRRPSAIEEQLYAHYRVGDVSYGMGLHRRQSRPFGRRELRLVGLFLQNAGHLLKDPDPPHKHLIDSLPLRLKPVLLRFLAGRSEKEVARELGLTVNTVHTYAKQLYRALGVNSRAEMMARFIDQPGEV
jgi:DNA-binding CsgD family transcriptional regulator